MQDIQFSQFVETPLKILNKKEDRRTILFYLQNSSAFQEYFRKTNINTDN